MPSPFRLTEENMADQRSEAALAGLVASEDDIQSGTEISDCDAGELAVADRFDLTKIHRLHLPTADRGTDRESARPLLQP